METFISRAFLGVDKVLEAHVQDGEYDIISPDGEIILPLLWDKIIQPGWKPEGQNANVAKGQGLRHEAANQVQRCCRQEVQLPFPFMLDMDGKFNSIQPYNLINLLIIY